MTESQTIVLRVTAGLKCRIALSALGLAFLFGLTYYWGTLHGLDTAVELRANVKQMTRQINQQSMQLDASQAEIVRIKKAAEVDRLAAESVRKELLTHQQEAADLQRDVEFYRGLMAPDELERGLQMHSFTVDYDHNLQRYDFKAVMTNAGSRGSVVKGQIDFELEALEGGKLTRLKFAALPSYTGSMPIKLRFRFFQNIEGSFQLNETLKPLRVIVSSSLKDASGAAFNRTYEWDLLARQH